MTKQKRLMAIGEACLFVADMRQRKLWYQPEKTVGYPCEIMDNKDGTAFVISTQDAFDEWDVKCEDGGPVVYWP